VREGLGQNFAVPMLGDPALPFVTGGNRMFVWSDSSFVLLGDSLRFLPGQTGFGTDRSFDTARPSIVYGIPGLGGQRFVAGVELTNLNPSLARYFRVDAGVLVTDVTEGSPGDEAGLLAGDVIVEVGGEAVRTLQEVRQAMNRNPRVRVLERGQGGFETTSPEPLTLRVIREGGSLDLEIPR
jgi:membrane-associated protease RseP (regulator of RpoE activity)